MRDERQIPDHHRRSIHSEHIGNLLESASTGEGGVLSDLCSPGVVHDMYADTNAHLLLVRE